MELEEAQPKKKKFQVILMNYLDLVLHLLLNRS